jgi:hypothetical protein
MVDVRVELYRSRTGSHLDFWMKVRFENINNVRDYVEFRYPDWILQNVVAGN